MARAKWASERARSLANARAASLAGRLVLIHPCQNRARRNRLERDDVKWLLHYFAPESKCESPFTYAFTIQQQKMIKAIGDAIKSGGDQSLAASRGEGKTTLFERMLLKYTLAGVVDFSVLFAATGQAAQDSLESVKTEIEHNDYLWADYPEVCVPVRALENTPNRAHYQIVSGRRHDNRRVFNKVSSKFSWCGQEIYFPNVPGSPSAGAIIATRGLDSAIRGLKKLGKRPQVAGIDDPDTEDSVRSEEQALKLEQRIDRGIAGLGGQKRRVARVMLSTIQNRTCVSYRFTDPQQKPSWHGQRFRFLITPPDRADLWDEYVQLKSADWQDGTDAALDLYVANRKVMEAGAVIANPNRYVSGELSALQHYYNEVARIGPEAVATEFDNDPPEEDGPIESGITAQKIQLRLSGHARQEIPTGCELIVQGIDIRKAGLHWVVRAFAKNATNYVVDYGFHETHGTRYGTDDGLELAIRRSILERMEQAKADYPTLNLTLVDSGWLAPAVYRACSEVGLGIYPAKGHGQSHGCASLSFTEVLKRTADRKPGDGWFMQRQQYGLWLVHCDTDRWKSYEHARWLTAEGQAGAAYLFGHITEEERKHILKRMPRDSKEHFGFAHHLTAEVEVEDVVRGKLKRFWKIKSGRANNHYLDASYLTDVAGSILGVKLLGEPQQSKAPKRKKVTYL